MCLVFLFLAVETAHRLEVARSVSEEQAQAGMMGTVIKKSQSTSKVIAGLARAASTCSCPHKYSWLWKLRTGWRWPGL
jgi:hypothetical protein